MTSGAVQMSAATPTESVSEHSPAKAAKTHGADRHDLEERPVSDHPGIPAKTYNSHGEVIEPPGIPLVDIEM
jgi:hypothetical protein